jgi:hypothetical protein
MQRPLRALLLFLFIASVHHAQNSAALKSILYDFDGLDIGATDLPDGDYRLGDLSYQVAVNPLGASEVLGDRVLQLDLNWQSGTGTFAKAYSRFIQLDAATDRLNFYFYNPSTNNSDTLLKLFITEDDNNSDTYEPGSDDQWMCTVPIPETGGWQLISAPLSSFSDVNTGGNGIFDVGFANNEGKLFSVSFTFSNTLQSPGPERYFIDMICFSEGALPTGPSVLDLPPEDPSASCKLGALSGHIRPDSTPIEIQALLLPGKRLTYVNWFLNYAKTGTTPNVYPDNSTLTLLQEGFRPVITWEMMFGEYPRLDPIQPRLDKILNGYFDSYIDNFADVVRNFNDTIIMRIFHEFEGDWYSWSLTENGQDPNVYINAYRHVVDRFRNRGATKVKWMWCVNAEPKPYEAYNWIISAYPGDNYVDIVATDVYNHPNTGIPPWKSFRYTVAESYYYLTSNFPNKPFFICEVGCRERYGSEDPTSQGKGEWLCQMGRDLETYFNKTQALIFFSTVKEHDWRINSSTTSLDAFRQCLWSDDFFGQPVEIDNTDPQVELQAYPNPFLEALTLAVSHLPPQGNAYNLKVSDLAGRLVYRYDNVNANQVITIGETLASGMYIIELSNDLYSRAIKVIKTKS